MKLTSKQEADFANIASQMIKWLNDNCHPHAKVIIDVTRAELVSCEMVHIDETHIKD